MTMYTSLELSKKLKKVNCDLESEYSWRMQNFEDGTNTEEFWKNSQEFYVKFNSKDSPSVFFEEFPAYDILWDICIRHKIEFWGEEKVCDFCGGTDFDDDRNENPYFSDCEDCDATVDFSTNSFQYHSNKILDMLQQNKLQKEIEQYIISNSRFFNNKKEEK